MNNSILTNFYHRTLSLYTPQAESLLDQAPSELFKRVSFRYAFSVQAMIKISRVIEQAALDHPHEAQVHVSFQKLSRVVDQKEMYSQINKVAQGLWLYGINDTPKEQLDFVSNAHLIDTSGTILTNYWFVVAYGPGVGMALLAEEVPSLIGTGRYFEGFYTFEADIAYQLLTIMHQIYPDDVPKPLVPERLIETAD
ncbi:MAG: DICT sensory domain-containing protein [Chloroflexota bacterium]